MIRAVLDTNVLVSNLLHSGVPRKILDQAGKKFQLVLSQPMLQEIADVIGRDYITRRTGMNSKEQQAFLEKLVIAADLIPGLVRLPLFKPDFKDTKILECAVEGKADYLVTGDIDLLNLGSIHGTKIIAPRDFLILLLQT